MFEKKKRNGKVGDLNDLHIIGDMIYRSHATDVHGQTARFTQHFGYPQGMKNGERYLGPQVRKEWCFPARVGVGWKAESRNVEKLYLDISKNDGSCSKETCPECTVQVRRENRSQLHGAG